MNIAFHKEHLPVRLSWVPFLPIWIIGSAAAYFLTSFFSNFYSSTYQFVLLSLTFQIICGMVAFLLLFDIFQNAQNNWYHDWTTALALFIAFCFSVSAVVISWQFP